MKVTINETQEQGERKLFCPYCMAAINSFWLRKDSKVKDITCKCKRCGKTLEITVE